MILNGYLWNLGESFFDEADEKESLDKEVSKTEVPVEETKTAELNHA
jgi:hypothetical protein